MIPLAAAIVAATAVGVALERRLGPRAEVLAGRLMWAMLWLALPVVAFFNIAALELTAEVGAGIGFAYAAMAVTLAIAWVAGSRLLGLAPPATGALMLVAAFANTGYLGLPFTVALLGFDDLPDAVAYDMLVSGVGVLTVGFAIGAAFGAVAERPLERVAAFARRNPALWATLLGFAAPAALAPGWAVEASQALAVSLLLPGFLAVGVTLASEAERGTLRFPPPLTAPVGVAIALKLVVAPAVVAALSATLLRVPDAYLAQAAMASALATLLIANEYGLDRRIAAGAIAWTTAIVVAVGIAAAPGLG